MVLKLYSLLFNNTLAKNFGEAKNRKFYIVREHNDEIEITNTDTYDGIFSDIVIGMIIIMVVMRKEMKEFKN